MRRKYLTGTLLDENIVCSLSDLCSMCNISAEMVHDVIDEGLIHPSGTDPRQWRFTSIEIRRIHTTIRLQRDLRVNLPGCALVLDLLDELEKLRRLQRNR